MYINKSTLEAIPGFTAFGNHFYWSSSDYSSNSAWGQFLNSGSWTDRNKSYANRCACCSGFLVIYQFNYLKLYRVSGRVKNNTN